MTHKTIMKWLEKLFSHEVCVSMEQKNDLPLQLPEKIAKKLIELGHVEEIEVKEGLMSFICHKLSFKGHIFYCANRK